MEKEVKDLLNKCDNCKLKQCESCEFAYTDIQNIKKYVENLEITNETLDKECSRLEQKEFILDKVTDKLSKMKQNIEKLKNRDGESMLMVDVCIQNIIAFYDDIEKIF